MDDEDKQLFYYFRLYYDTEDDFMDANPYEFTDADDFSQSAVENEIVFDVEQQIEQDFPLIMEMAFRGEFNQTDYLLGELNGMTFESHMLVERFLDIMGSKIHEKTPDEPEEPEKDEDESSDDEAEECCICMVHKNPGKFSETHCCKQKTICQKCFIKIMKCPLCRKKW